MKRQKFDGKFPGVFGILPAKQRFFLFFTEFFRGPSSGGKLGSHVPGTPPQKNVAKTWPHFFGVEVKLAQKIRWVQKKSSGKSVKSFNFETECLLVEARCVGWNSLCWLKLIVEKGTADEQQLLLLSSWAVGLESNSVRKLWVRLYDS